MDAGIEDLLAAGRHARAFDLVVPAYKDRVFRLAYSILKERAAAEDATQETLVRVWKALPGFDGRAQLGTWIYAITRNTCLMELRRRRAYGVLRRPGLDRGPARGGEHRLRAPRGPRARQPAPAGGRRCHQPAEAGAALLPGGPLLRGGAEQLGMPLGTVKNLLHARASG